MTGKQHLTAGATLSVLGVTMYQDVVATYENESILHTIKTVKEFLVSDTVWLWPVCVLFLFIGFLLPDCDTKNSMLGRYVHIPIEHRTWVHTIWFVLILFLPGFVFKPFFCLALGAFIHLFCDSFSKCGVCWFFPDYNYYGHAKIKNGHLFYLYRSELSAWIVCAVLILFTVLFILGVLDIIGPIRDVLDIVHNTVEKTLTFVVNLF